MSDFPSLPSEAAVGVCDIPSSPRSQLPAHWVDLGVGGTNLLLYLTVYRQEAVSYVVGQKRLLLFFNPLDFFPLFLK